MRLCETETPNFVRCFKWWVYEAKLHGSHDHRKRFRIAEQLVYLSLLKSIVHQVNDWVEAVIYGDL